MTLVFLLEEKSMKYYLDGILPKILPEGIDYLTIPHEGKRDLQKSIPVKLKGWTRPDTKFVIVQDQDSNDCRVLKRKLLELCSPYHRDVLIRIACHELEAWYFGDISALSKAYHKDLSAIQKKKAYRIPDRMENPKRALQKLLPEHQQISGAKLMAEYADVENNTSESFQVFISGIRKMCADT